MPHQIHRHGHSSERGGRSRKFLLELGQPYPFPPAQVVSTYTCDTTCGNGYVLHSVCSARIVRASRAYGNSHLAAALLLQCARLYAALCRIVRAPRAYGNSHLAAALLLQCTRLYAVLCRIVHAPPCVLAATLLPRTAHIPSAVVVQVVDTVACMVLYEPQPLW